jgi:hypothetical protein
MANNLRDLASWMRDLELKQQSIEVIARSHEYRLGLVVDALKDIHASLLALGAFLGLPDPDETDGSDDARGDTTVHAGRAKVTKVDSDGSDVPSISGEP